MYEALIYLQADSWNMSKSNTLLGKSNTLLGKSGALLGKNRYLRFSLQLEQTESEIPLRERVCVRYTNALYIHNKLS